MASTRHTCIALSVIAGLLCSTGAQAFFCFSFGGGSDSKRSYGNRYAPHYPPPYPAMYSQGMQPMPMPGMNYSPAYAVPQQQPYGVLLPVQPDQ